MQGDSHTYLVDQPLPLDNLTRIVVHGETLPFEYLRLSDRSHETPTLFHWERVPVATDGRLTPIPVPTPVRRGCDSSAVRVVHRAVAGSSGPAPTRSP